MKNFILGLSSITVAIGLVAIIASPELAIILGVSLTIAALLLVGFLLIITAIVEKQDDE